MLAPDAASTCAASAANGGTALLDDPASPWASRESRATSGGLGCPATGQPGVAHALERTLGSEADAPPGWQGGGGGSGQMTELSRANGGYPATLLDPATLPDPKGSWDVGAVGDVCSSRDGGGVVTAAGVETGSNSLRGDCGGGAAGVGAAASGGGAGDQRRDTQTGAVMDGAREPQRDAAGDAGGTLVGSVEVSLAASTRTRTLTLNAPDVRNPVTLTESC